MKNNTHIADVDFALYAMDALPQADAAQAQAHLAVCARCTEELRQAQLALAAYAQTAPEADVPAGAKQRFMARVAQLADEPASTPKAAPAPAVARPRKKSWSMGWALAGVLALLLLALGVDDQWKSAEMKELLAAAQRGQADSAKLNQIMELLTSTQVQKASLHETAAPAHLPEARVIYAPRNGKLLLTASNLHPLPAGKTYELWLLQPSGKKPLAAGTFSPDSGGNANIILGDAPANVAIAGFGVTIENSGGSDVPTSPVVMSGQ